MWCWGWKLWSCSNLSYVLSPLNRSLMKCMLRDNFPDSQAVLIFEGEIFSLTCFCPRSQKGKGRKNVPQILETWWNCGMSLPFHGIFGPLAQGQHSCQQAGETESKEVYVLLSAAFRTHDNLRKCSVTTLFPTLHLHHILPVPSGSLVHFCLTHSHLCLLGKGVSCHWEDISNTQVHHR